MTEAADKAPDAVYFEAWLASHRSGMHWGCAAIGQHCNVETLRRQAQARAQEPPTTDAAGALLEHALHCDHEDCLTCKEAHEGNTAAAAQAERERIEASWAEWVVERDDEKHVTDWACDECVTEAVGDRLLIHPGFRCIPHKARQLLAERNEG